MLSWLRSRALAASEALERAIAHARRAGDRALIDELRGHGAGPIMLGPAPPAAMRAWIEATERESGGALARFGTEATRGVLATMEYRLDEARAHLAAGHAVLKELGFELLASSSGQLTSRVALAEGDVDEAVRLLRASFEAGARLGDRSYHSTTGAYLADALRRQGKLEEAERMALEMEVESAPEDVINFVITRGVRSLVAAARGDLERALDLAREAVGYAQQTDFPVHMAESLVTLGAVLRMAGDESEAAAAFERAAALADAKGDQPVADWVRAVEAGAPA
jgi:tetratricopeptide (TPR) repeat protein